MARRTRHERRQGKRLEHGDEIPEVLRQVYEYRTIHDGELRHDSQNRENKGKGVRLITWIKYRIKRYQVGKFWQKRAEQYYRELSLIKSPDWDCDKRVSEMIKEMNEKGMRAGYDYVADRGTINGVDHVRLNVCGMMIDPATNNGEFGFKRTFLGAYISPQKEDIKTFFETAQKMRRP